MSTVVVVAIVAFAAGFLAGVVLSEWFGAAKHSPRPLWPIRGNLSSPPSDFAVPPIAQLSTTTDQRDGWAPLDSDRLDWLQGHECIVVPPMNLDAQWRVQSLVGPMCGATFQGHTLRAAIDAARQGNVGKLVARP